MLAPPPDDGCVSPCSGECAGEMVCEGGDRPKLPDWGRECGSPREVGWVVTGRSWWPPGTWGTPAGAGAGWATRRGRGGMQPPAACRA
jgi:hypothetical protein